MTRVRLRIVRLGPHFRMVLVRGEAGTGKELVARWLHDASYGSTGPFMVCDGSEDFSACSGSGNGAGGWSSRLDRLVKMAQGGTLFLKYVDEMPVEAQEQLLQILRRQECSGKSTKGIGLRVIASTREDLKLRALTGRFPQELHHRLTVVEIALPPLRERREDIPQLAMYLLRRLALARGKDVETIAGDAFARLEAYDWPGNVRELESVLHQAVLRCKGVVLEASDLPELARFGAERPSTFDSLRTERLQDVIDHHVLRVLKNCAGNKLRAAELLGISRSTLYRMLESRS